MYQPIPFDGYQGTSHVRGDCGERFKVIESDYDFSGKSVLDFGCAEGYFGFRALKSGASFVRFVDNDSNCLNIIREVAHKNGFLDRIETAENGVGGPYDCVFLLSLWSEPGMPSLSELSKSCQTLFVSCSGNGNEKNDRLANEAQKHFGSVMALMKGYQNRVIFRCDK